MDTSEAGKAARTVDGRLFASKREAARYRDLALAAKAGQIVDLECQVPYVLHAPDGTAIGKYVADFRYRMQMAFGNWATIVEDAKGAKTDLYKWKKKHTEAEYQTEIWEV